MALRRSPHDREILRLAVPALGALAAEPLYVLADTAIVGHLGTRELAALALAATILGSVVALCNFLAYGTTAQVARLHGAGETARADAMAAQSLYLATAVGVGVALLLVALASPLTALLNGEANDLAARYLRLSAPGVPCALIALAGQGYLRGVDRLRTPLVILIAANAANVVLEVVLVYGLDLGLDGSALGTVAAQLGMAAAFAYLLLDAHHARRPDLLAIRRLMGYATDLLLRTGSLLAAFTVASAVVARESDAALAAHQIAMQLFIFLALVLDAIAIAGQVIVGRMLGASDLAGALAAARRMILWSLVVGCGFGVLLLALTDLIPRAFSSDGAVLHEARLLWPLFALLQPSGAIVFALDGILIGASDTRYIARAMVVALLCFLPVVLVANAQGWGVVGIWSALNVLMVARLATMALRFNTQAWARVGATV